MPSELQRKADDETTVKNLLVKEHGEVLFNPMQSFLLESKQNVEKKSSTVARRSCICSPTTHAGSFRCKLHRTIPPQEPFTQAAGFGCNKTSTQNNPWSRFGRYDASTQQDNHLH